MLPSEYDLGLLIHISAADATTIQNNLVSDHQTYVTNVTNGTVVLVDGPVSGFSFSDVGFITSGKNLTSGKNITANFNVISLSADLFNDYSPTGSNLVNGKNLVSGKNLTSGKNLVSGKNIMSPTIPLTLTPFLIQPPLITP
jgi:hypothetical protein